MKKLNRSNNMYEANIEAHLRWMEESLERYKKELEKENNFISAKKLQRIEWINQSISTIDKNLKEMEEQGIETYSSSGGFYHAETPLDDGRLYAVVSNDYINCLSIYQYKNEDEKYLEEDMIYCKNYEDMEEDEAEFKELYKQLHQALRKYMESIR